MLSLRSIFLAGTALSLFALPAFAGPSAAFPGKPIVLAQAEITDPAVLAAQEAVENARAALRDAMATGGDVKAARRALNQAMKGLNEARVAAGLPPLGKDGDAAGKEQPADQPPAASTETPPLPEDPPAAIVETPPPAEEAPAATVETPPATEEAPGATVDTPPDQPAAVTDTETPPEKPLKKGKKRPAQAETQSDAPAAVTETPADETQGKPFRKKKPRFGQGEGAPEEATPTPPPQFSEEGKPPVKTGADVKEGQEIEASDGRVVSKEGGELIIKSDDDTRFKREGKVTTQPTKDGGSITTVTRLNGVQVVTIRDRDGDIVQRFRKMPDGQIEILIGALEGPGGPPGPEGQKFPKRPKFRPGKGVPPIGAGGDFNFEVYLPPVRIEIPEDDYIVESRRASRRQIDEALEAEPVERIERPYSLEEIRRSERLRQKVRRIDIDTITFEFGSAEVPEDQVPSLQTIGESLQRIIQRDPNEVYLIEGHTDAVGSDLANLALSDRRAESVAEILTYYFEIPPENLITQGYGESYLKIDTLAPERENRRVTMRRITPLLGSDEFSQQQ